MHFRVESALGILLAALLVDWFVGEYPAWMHPVVWLGKAISGCLRIAPHAGWWRQVTFGAMLALGICGFAAAAALLLMQSMAELPLLQILAGTFLLKASFALRELRQAAFRVVLPLRDDDLPRARIALRSLCSRDSSCLTREELLAATIESLAENASDSFVAPLFYYVLLGVPGAIGYRAINTLDAMVGYRGQFEALGKASARLDDLANWVPARLTANLLLLWGGILGKNVAQGWKILRRDGAKTPSPNGGRPMAVMAGLLGVELEKKGSYVLGDPHQALTEGKVREAAHLVLCTGIAMTGLSALILFIVIRWVTGTLPFDQA